MSGIALKNGVPMKISVGEAKLGGTAYPIHQGKTKVGGVVKDIILGVKWLKYTAEEDSNSPIYGNKSRDKYGQIADPTGSTTGYTNCDFSPRIGWYTHGEETLVGWDEDTGLFHTGTVYVGGGTEAAEYEYWDEGGYYTLTMYQLTCDIVGYYFAPVDFDSYVYAPEGELPYDESNVVASDDTFTYVYEQDNYYAYKKEG
jgi:hypothetical protein